MINQSLSGGSLPPDFIARFSVYSVDGLGLEIGSFFGGCDGTDEDLV